MFVLFVFFPGANDIIHANSSGGNGIYKYMCSLCNCAQRYDTVSFFFWNAFSFLDFWEDNFVGLSRRERVHLQLFQMINVAILSNFFGGIFGGLSIRTRMWFDDRNSNKKCKVCDYKFVFCSHFYMYVCLDMTSIGLKLTPTIRLY